jgi:voltage-gated potassium channel
MSSLDKYLYRYLLCAAAFALSFGTIFYHLVEHLSWLDAYYFSVITLTTVGYGDITPHTAAGKIFTSIYVLFGIGVITTFISLRIRRRGEKFQERRQRRNPKDS